jgi:hypothetical protein
MCLHPALDFLQNNPLGDTSLQSADSEDDDNSGNNASDPNAPGWLGNGVLRPSCGVVIGQNMNGRVIPFANNNGLGYYQPSQFFADPNLLEEENMQWIDNVMNEGIPVYNLGPDPGATSPSSALEAEYNALLKNNYPVNSPSLFMPNAK